MGVVPGDSVVDSLDTNICDGGWGAGFVLVFPSWRVAHGLLKVRNVSAIGCRAGLELGDVFAMKQRKVG